MTPAGLGGAIIDAVTEPQSDDGVRRRELRRDAADNRNRVLAAAAAAVRREGTAVPMATVASDAGVGVGTVYRHFPSREALLGALTYRSFRLVLDAATEAAETDQLGISAIRGFLDQTIEHGPDLVLPLHGGPVLMDQATVAIQAEVHRRLGSLLRRGRQDGTIRRDVRTADLVIFGALLAQQLPHIPDWNRNARRLVDIYLAGMAPTTRPPD
ncbi:MAG: TetR/AcrR family transcriptional regulator [Vicinamibacterales bacterium]